ncbi:hypothetical protein Pdw03_1750 [Penicillium digitatum]|uniref:Uncharacterized protein n=1 Tax=Penicillium digitatum TaxID=36651 RepID=A0A7T7BP09_PENDI|nr:hypothetical protein Pdw03_1750 [Penicillium digitatum]
MPAPPSNATITSERIDNQREQQAPFDQEQRSCKQASLGGCHSTSSYWSLLASCDLPVEILIDNIIPNASNAARDNAAYSEKRYAKQKRRGWQLSRREGGSIGDADRARKDNIRWTIRQTRDNTVFWEVVALIFQYY